MSHRAKYSLEEKMKVLSEYDNGKATKKIAEETQIPISTVMYFIRNRSRFETEATNDLDTNHQNNVSHNNEKKIRFSENINQKQIENELNQKKKRTSFKVRPNSVAQQQSSSEDETNNEQTMIRIRKIPNDMKLKIIKAWENRNRDNGIGLSMRKIAESFGVSTRSVSRCVAARKHLKPLINENKEEEDDEEENDVQDEEQLMEQNTNENPDGVVDTRFFRSICNEAFITNNNSDNYDDDYDDENEDDDEQEPEQEYFVVSDSSLKNSQSRRRHIEASTSIDINNTISNLDQELVESVNNIFDQLKRIKSISQRLPPPINLNALEFTEAMLTTANNYVNRLQRTSSMGQVFSNHHYNHNFNNSQQTTQQQTFQMKQKMRPFSLSLMDHDWPSFFPSTSMNSHLNQKRTRH